MIFAGCHLQTEEQRGPAQHPEHQPAGRQGPHHHRPPARHHILGHHRGAKLLVLSLRNNFHHHPECFVVIPRVLHHPSLLLPQRGGVCYDQTSLGRLEGHQQHWIRTKLSQELHCHAGHVQHL